MNSVIHPYVLPSIAVLGILVRTGYQPSGRPQYFAFGYIHWIENFLVQKMAGETGIGQEFQIHCGTTPPTRMENTDPVPISYIYPIRRSSYSHGLWKGEATAARPIVTEYPSKWSRVRRTHQLPYEQGARHIRKIQHA